MKDLKDKKFLVLSVLFFLLFTAAITSMIVMKPTSNLLSAKNVSLSPLKSFAIVFPQVGAAGSENSANQPTKLKVSVFARDVNGTVLPNRNIKLSSKPETLSIQPSNTQLTDNIGKAEFIITSAKAGKVQLIATDTSTNADITNIPSVEFTE